MMQPPRLDETGFIGTFPEKRRGGTIKSVVSINISAVAEDIREVLADWEEMDLDDVLPTVPPGRPEGYPTDEVLAVEFVAAALRITAERVLDAVGIKSRTFYGWKEKGRRPRASSIGCIWAAVEPVFYLSQSRPNLVAWFAESAEAQSLFDAGEFDALVALESEWWARGLESRAAQAPYTHLQDAAASPSESPVGGPRPTRVRPVPVTPTGLGWGRPTRP